MRCAAKWGREKVFRVCHNFNSVSFKNNNNNVWTRSCWIFLCTVYFSTPLLAHLYTILNCVCLWWAMDDEFDHCFNYDQSLSGAFEAKECYELVSFSSIFVAHHNIRTYQSTLSFYPQIPWAMRRILVKRFYQSRLQECTEDKKILGHPVLF